MKKLGLILAVVGSTLLLTACGKGNGANLNVGSNTFYCDFCGEEKTGKKYVSNELGEDLVMCQDCKNDFNSDGEPSSNNSNVDDNAGTEELNIEVLPEIANGGINDLKLQICDVIVRFDGTMTESEVKAALDSSEYDLQFEEGWSGDYPTIQDVYLNGQKIVRFNWNYVNTNNFEDQSMSDNVLINVEVYNDTVCFTSALVYEEDFTGKTRDDVISFLNQNGFVEAENSWEAILKYDSGCLYANSDNVDTLNNTSIYVDDGTKSITLYSYIPINDKVAIAETKFGKSINGIQNFAWRKMTFYFNPDGTFNGFIEGNPATAKIYMEKPSAFGNSFKVGCIIQTILFEE